MGISLARDLDSLFDLTSSSPGVERNWRTDSQRALQESLAKGNPLGLMAQGFIEKKGDLNEDVIRAVGLRHDLVDVKVISVDDIWSGLKFVHRCHDAK